MKRKAYSLLLCLMLVSALVLSVSAASELPRVIDGADLLTAGEEDKLEQLSQAIRTNYEMDVVILTVDTLGGKTAQDYADDYYDEHGYGCGGNASGLLLLLAMEEREWYISTCGDAIYAFTDYGLEQISDLVVPYLSGGSYYQGFVTFMTALPDYLDAFSNGMPIDGYASDYDPNRSDVVFYETERHVNVVISLVIGIMAAAITVGVMCYSMNTKRMQAGAGDYLKPGSYQLRVQRDMFLYSNVSKVRRQENNSSGGHGGGGSSIHTSSSSRSHGGRGGGF